MEIKEQAFSLNLCRAWGGPVGCADFRTTADDFIVVELLQWPFSDDGDHIYLKIRKRNQNTRRVAENLAQIFGVALQDIGYCGLKDRRAVTTQWFSIRHSELPLGLQAGSQLLAQCEVLRVTRHRRKLSRGMHSGNAFDLHLRNFEGDMELAEQRLITIGGQGVPNYFGEQRFGIDGGNLLAADRLLSQSSSRKSRDPKWGLYVSAARAHLFNSVLSARIGQGIWATAVGGETVPSGPLWGRGRSSAGKELAELEARVLAPHAVWCHGLEHCGLQQERRDLIVVPSTMSWQWQQRDLHLAFTLPPGAFATAVLRELLVTNVPADSAML
ncbi:MAG: tRNA pseudouridine(13) synthase TruD [Gammaproteobacteria bacterium]|nr:MAG: tRNA pseudouridine(13) synthase TruD [Gammaproteobacteria bacterium]